MAASPTLPSQTHRSRNATATTTRLYRGARSRYSPTTRQRLPKAVAKLEQRHLDDLSWSFLPISLSSDLCDLLTDFQTSLLPLVRPKWTAEALGYRIFEDGVTNKLFGFFQVGKKEEDMVLVRINGEGRELFIESRVEILVMLTLHKARISPPLYLVTNNAMCYGYIPGRTLTGGEMQRDEVLQATAHTLARFHAVPLPRALQYRQPHVWAKIDEWMSLVSDEFTDAASKQRVEQVLLGSLDDLKGEVEWLKSELGAPGHISSDGVCVNGDSATEQVKHLACHSPCVLCHNDAQPLNFVLSNDGKLTLIDLEYSGKNYPAFDIGCFFCEFAGCHGTVDYNRYPSESVQKKWITHYLEECARLKGEDAQTVTPAQVDRMYRDANQFALAAHFMWTLWSLVQYKHSTITFDYLEYGGIRYAEYQKRKSTNFNFSHSNHG